MSVTINGTNGLTFNDASTQNTAATGFGFKNRIINGGMTIDQRNAGASVTPTDGSYTLDRWKTWASQASKFTIQQNAAGVTPPSGFTNYLGVGSTSSYSVGASDYFGIAQYIEGYNVADLGWGAADAKSVTLSFQVYSSLTGTFGGAINNSGFNRSYPFSYSIPVANTWTTVSVTIPGDTSGTWNKTTGIGMSVFLGIGVGSTVSGTAGTWSGNSYYSATGAVSVVGTNAATFFVTGVQLEKGNTATSFDYRPYGTELALCQRYYEVSYSGSDNVDFTSSYFVTSNNRATWWFKVQKRAAPTFALASGAGWTNVTPTVLTNTARVTCYGGDYYYVITGSPYGVSLTASAEL